MGGDGSELGIIKELRERRELGTEAPAADASGLGFPRGAEGNQPSF